MAKTLNKTAAFGYFVGRSEDKDIRIKSTSGGIGTSIVKYLLSTEEYDTALSFEFDKKRCMYIPKFIHDFTEYNNCGSIYQEIDIPNFLRAHLNEIGKGVILSAPPCQIPLIRKIFQPLQVNTFVISFCCSGQTTIEGTWKYYDIIGVKKEKVRKIQYRGNGWPSGIQIELDDGKIIYRDNWTKPWTDLFLSRLFSPKCCCLCKLVTSYNSDISLADPWLKKYRQNDTEGHTMYLVNTEKGKSVIVKMTNNGLISSVPSSEGEFFQAQKENVDKARRIEETKKMINIHLKLKKNRLFVKLASYSLFTIRIHNKIMNVICRLFSVIGGN
jgi:coenzyme F420-reducing hydrogenase beta subunit